jgi:thiol-disulfide isomerase/thioredoxin
MSTGVWGGGRRQATRSPKCQPGFGAEGADRRPEAPNVNRVTAVLKPGSMIRSCRWVAASALCLVWGALSGCSNEGGSAPGSAGPRGSNQATTRGVGRVEWLAAPDSGDVAAVVKGELMRARADGGRDLLVYVGATWCEPCQHFHQAAEKGELDAVFPRLRVLEFDLDRDRDRLASAGYISRLIPLFVVPKEDGTASARRVEGGTKGEAAVGDIASRLRRILPSASTQPGG